VIDCAIAEKVDFVLISGDFFDKTKIDPMTLIKSVEGLKRLQADSIKAIAISENHDRILDQDGIS
jgi:DNA repair exonuclease SbcCD nuclease subunit